jgi:hypothetical protein
MKLFGVGHFPNTNPDDSIIAFYGGKLKSFDILRQGTGFIFG